MMKSADFEENLDRLFDCLFTDPDRAWQTLQEMIQELEKVENKII